MSAATKCDVCGNLVEQKNAVYFDVTELKPSDRPANYWVEKAVCHRCWDNPLRATLIKICRGLKLRQPTRKTAAVRDIPEDVYT